MKKLLIAGLLALLPSEAFATKIVQRVVVKEQVRIVERVQFVDRVVNRAAFVLSPSYAVQQIALPVYAAPTSPSCTEQLRVLEAQYRNLQLENQNLRLQQGK